MFTNPTPDQLRSLLREVKTIAVVGLSPNVARPSYRVSRAMQGFGYRIVPVRPAVSEVLGEKAYARLSDIPFEVEDRPIVIVDDVLYTGRTIRAAMNEIFDFNILLSR